MHCLSTVDYYSLLLPDASLRTSSLLSTPLSSSNADDSASSDDDNGKKNDSGPKANRLDAEGWGGRAAWRPPLRRPWSRRTPPPPHPDPPCGRPAAARRFALALARHGHGAEQAVERALGERAVGLLALGAVLALEELIHLSLERAERVRGVCGGRAGGRQQRQRTSVDLHKAPRRRTASHHTPIAVLVQREHRCQTRTRLFSCVGCPSLCAASLSPPSFSRGRGA